MMAQYLSIKAGAGDDVLLFYRMGDFYELFFDDAVKAAAALDIALTKRGKHQGADIPMCGVPVHASETYLQRLIKQGFRVAVCEQTEDPADAKKRGYKAVVRREIVRTVTPGTLSEDSLLDARGANIILSLYQSLSGDWALAWADITEGLFRLSAVAPERLDSEITALAPRELILPENLYQDPQLLMRLNIDHRALTPLARTKFDPRSGETQLKNTFGVQSLDGFGAFSRAEISAAGALLDYITLTQAGAPVRLSPPRQQQARQFMAIDPATRASLEIDRTQQGSRKGSLLAVIDKTVTGAGARQLASWLNRPLIDPMAINARLDVVDFFVQDRTRRMAVRETLKQSGDLARAASRISLGRGGPRDVKTIAAALQTAQDLCPVFINMGTVPLPETLSALLDNLSLLQQAELARLSADISQAFKDDVPLLARDGGFIQKGWDAPLDQLRQLRDDSRRIIAQLQASYGQKTGIPNLKIKHNNVLGYFIEVTPKHADRMLNMGADSPFIHRQTLVSGVRFTTTELAELDAKISGAADKALGLELAIFDDFTARITAQAEPLRRVAGALAEMDVYAALAQWADDHGAVRPKIDDSDIFHIKSGRHPVVEAALNAAGSAPFTANDCKLDVSGQDAPRLTLITGPNMAGKSTYLRQNALMFVLAQSGSFVPAQSAHIGVADSLFSRVGASDDLSKGRSTFMTEMIETAAILNLASAKSFIILDEIGRGTATFDGLSIAWATAEHLHSVNRARALFATHYHELTDLSETLEAAGNACLRAKEWEGDLIFLHDVKPGAADKSYGVQVAKLAGLPPAAIERARQVLAMLENNHDSVHERLGGLPLFSAVMPNIVTSEPSDIDKAIAALDIDTLSPRAALDLLYELKAKQGPL